MKWSDKLTKLLVATSFVACALLGVSPAVLGVYSSVIGTVFSGDNR